MTDEKLFDEFKGVRAELASLGGAVRGFLSKQEQVNTVLEKAVLKLDERMDTLEGRQSKLERRAAYAAGAAFIAIPVLSLVVKLLVG